MFHQTLKITMMLLLAVGCKGVESAVKAEESLEDLTQIYLDCDASGDFAGKEKFQKRATLAELKKQSLGYWHNVVFDHPKYFSVVTVDLNALRVRSMTLVNKESKLSSKAVCFGGLVQAGEAQLEELGHNCAASMGTHSGDMRQLKIDDDEQFNEAVGQRCRVIKWQGRR